MDILKDAKYGTSKKCSYEKNDTPVLRIPNILNGKISTDNLKYKILHPARTNHSQLKREMFWS